MPSVPVGLLKLQVFFFYVIMLFSIGPPASPLSLNVDRLTNVSCNLSWRVPSDEGGRNDTFYNITYMEVGSISGSSVPVSTVNTNYVIGNLKPVTTYQVIVTAENGVSHNELSLDQVHQRTAVVVCTTTEGGEWSECAFGVLLSCR